LMWRVISLTFIFSFLLVEIQADQSIQNVHIALAGKNGMVISWLTEYPTEDSFVLYGLQRDDLFMKSNGNQTSYGSNAGWNHNVVLTNLIPNTRYFYSCGSSSIMSSQYEFVTISNDPFTGTIAAYGDMGIDNSENTMNQLINRTNNGDFDLFLHMGDISYANDHSQQYEETWNEWFTDMEPITSTIPYMVVPGNHESVCKAFGCFEETTNFTTYKQKFRMPGFESGTNSSMFYSFDFGFIHFIGISTESGYPGAPPLESDFPYIKEEDDEESYFQVNWLKEGE